jgi:GNAT superfamily N-acetyltransferase
LDHCQSWSLTAEGAISAITTSRLEASLALGRTRFHRAGCPADLGRNPLGSVEGTVGDATLERATDVFAELGADKASGWHFYLARIAGRPDGTSALHLGSGGGTLLGGTLPSVRRRGVGTALSVRALADAQSAGYGVATLTASVWRPSRNLGERRSSIQN